MEAAPLTTGVPGPELDDSFVIAALDDDTPVGCTTADDIADCPVGVALDMDGVDPVEDVAFCTGRTAEEDCTGRVAEDDTADIEAGVDEDMADTDAAPEDEAGVDAEEERPAPAEEATADEDCGLVEPDEDDWATTTDDKRRATRTSTNTDSLDILGRQERGTTRTRDREIQMEKTTRGYVSRDRQAHTQARDAAV